MARVKGQPISQAVQTCGEEERSSFNPPELEQNSRDPDDFTYHPHSESEDEGQAIGIENADGLVSVRVGTLGSVQAIVSGMHLDLSVGGRRISVCRHNDELTVYAPPLKKVPKTLVWSEPEELDYMSVFDFPTSSEESSITQESLSEIKGLDEESSSFEHDI